MNARPRVAVADTGSGNLRSVEKALAAAGADVIVTTDADQVAAADKVVVPGQGAFGGCVAGLSRHGGALGQAVRQAIASGRPYLGICLGLQVLFEGSEEDPTCQGLAVLPGRVRRFAETPGLKIPHMGWNATLPTPTQNAPVLAQTPPGTFFYFVHSYYADPARAGDVALQTEHGVRFCAAVARDNIFACQFHPEKSQQAGLGLLRSFVAL
ncbi:MAG TPA: imidazole glycerol phosphate synthase subunit HisH [Polyangia bacterium]|jgi:glutamine amidotransferase|nr:imidazole glycerol phosphate synthase subunit HisH [Polyangia bacterium]